MLAFVALKLLGDPKHRAVNSRAIVVGELDNACLDDETAEFDEPPGAVASLDLPCPHVIASLCRSPAIVCCPVALERREGCAEMPEQFAGTCFRKTSLHAWPMPHALPCLSSQ